MRKVTKVKEDAVLDTLGKRIEYLRTNMGISQAELAQTILIQRELLNKIENGTRSPKIEVLKDIATQLNTTTDYLLCRIDTPSIDVDNMAIGNKLGLSPKAIDKLESYYTSRRDYDVAIMNHLLEGDGLYAICQSIHKTIKRRIITVEDSERFWRRLEEDIKMRNMTIEGSDKIIDARWREAEEIRTSIGFGEYLLSETIRGIVKNAIEKLLPIYQKRYDAGDKKLDKQRPNRQNPSAGNRCKTPPRPKIVGAESGSRPMIIPTKSLNEKDGESNGKHNPTDK